MFRPFLRKVDESKSVQNGKKLRKAAPKAHNVVAVKENRPQQTSFPVVSVSESWQRDRQTGEIDHTALLHGLAHRESVESFKQSQITTKSTQPGQSLLARLPSKIWTQILQYITTADTVSLVLSCKAFYDLVGGVLHLDDPDRIDLLIRLDEEFSEHLLCFSCARYHRRLRPGKESLQPTNIANPLYNCPNGSNSERRPSRIRLTFGRTLPFTFVQLVLRAHRYGPAYGVPIDAISRRYKDREGTWSHQTRYAIVDNHLLLRVQSTSFAPAGLPASGLRHLLYSREDFVPYFSVCPHWRDGELMAAVKCALGHVPIPLRGSGIVRLGQEVQNRLHPPRAIVTLCEMCRPMRRCPECATEYLIEIKIAEDRTDTMNLFKQTLVVTRWSDLGGGTSPWAPEWAAVNGDAGFDSFAALGRRAISGVFESQFNPDAIPGQRIVSMNPRNEKKGEAGHDWY